MPSVRSHNEYILSIRLAGIEPTIWRRIVAPGQLTLHQPELFSVQQVNAALALFISLSSKS